jgi:hypothetical protein
VDVVEIHPELGVPNEKIMRRKPISAAVLAGME